MRKSWTTSWKKPIKVQKGSSDFYWLVGLLEGEGSFFPAGPSQPQAGVRLEFKMVDLDVMSRVSTLLGAKVSSPIKVKRYIPIYRIQIAGSKAVTIMEMIYPYMGIRRQEQISHTLQTYYDATGFTPST